MEWSGVEWSGVEWSYGEVLVDKNAMQIRATSLKVLEYNVNFSFGYILYCGSFNLYCVCFNLYCGCFNLY